MDEPSLRHEPCPGRSPLLLAGLVFAGLPLALARGDDCGARVSHIRPPVLLPIEAPQGIAVDPTDGTFWIVSALSRTVLHVGMNLEVLGSFQSPLTAPELEGTAGIAYNSISDKLLLCHSTLLVVQEVDRLGNPTDLRISLELPPPPNLVPRPFVKGLAFDPGGNGGEGTVWVVDSIMAAVYEVDFDGTIHRSFCAPDDPDGCPGKGTGSWINDVEIVPDGDVAFEVTGGNPRDRILRVDADGVYLGQSLPLVDVGGRPGGFARGRVRDPVTGDLRDALIVSVESSGELCALAVEEASLLPIEDLHCDPGPGTAALTWKGYDDYEGIRIYRDGEVIANIGGSSESFTDGAAPGSILRYEVVAYRGACESSLACQVVLGHGQVIRAVRFEGYWAVGIAEDAQGFLWVTDFKNDIYVYDKDLARVDSFPGPFQEEGDTLSGIAYSPLSDTFFVYNEETEEVVEMNRGGEPVGDRFPSGVPSDPGHEAIVATLLFNPAGDGGAGSFWYLDVTTSTIQERTRGGVLLESCVHPDWVAGPPPAGALFTPSTFGMTPVPGKGFGELYVSGGRIRDVRTKRVFRFVPAGCTRTPDEMPVEGIAAVSTPYLLGLHATDHGGRPVFYVVNSSPYRSWLLEVDLRPPGVPAVADLTCAQPAETPAVHLAFLNPGGLDAVEVRRDGALLATLPGDAGSHEDAAAPEGLRVYGVRGIKGGAAGDDRECAVQVGPGSIAAREFLPASFVHQLAPDPGDGSFVAASISNVFSDSLFRLGPDLKPRGSFPSPFLFPFQVAGLAVRPAAGGSEIFAIGWQPGASQGSQPVLPLRIVDAQGRFLREFAVSPPKPRGGFVTYPAGMAWDSATDSLWYLERNAFQIVHMTLQGETIAQFPHPAPIHQDRVINYGIAVDGPRNVLYLSAAGRHDFQVTKLVEVTRSGFPTGVEVPVGTTLYRNLWGFAPDSEAGFVVAASAATSWWDAVRYRAFAALPPVQDLTCRAAGEDVRLSWTPGGAYEELLVFRDEVLATTLPGGAGEWIDTDAAGVRFYRVLGQSGGRDGPGVVCLPDRGVFLRGDVEENGVVNITDAIAILSYLFLGWRPPRCLDAADVNDQGGVNITDAILVLGFLFGGGPPPAPPYPAAGPDPTPDDGMVCYPR